MRRSQWGAALVGLFAVVGVGWAGIATAAPRQPQPPPPPEPIVGTNPAVQAWFKAHEAERLALNDALQAAYDQLGQGSAPGGGDGCQRLSQAADTVLASLPTAPKKALNPLAVAGVALLKVGAQQCLAGNAAAARTTLGRGAQLRANAQLQIDELLEQPDGSVQ